MFPRATTYKICSTPCSIGVVHTFLIHCYSVDMYISMLSSVHVLTCMFSFIDTYPVDLYDGESHFQVLSCQNGTVLRSTYHVPWHVYILTWEWGEVVGWGVSEPLGSAVGRVATVIVRPFQWRFICAACIDRDTLYTAPSPSMCWLSAV